MLINSSCIENLDNSAKFLLLSMCFVFIWINVIFGLCTSKNITNPKILIGPLMNVSL